MKKLLTLLALCVAGATVAPAHARTTDVMVAGNNGGGEIVLTGEPCPLDPTAGDFRGALTYGTKGDMLVGCWTVAGVAIVIVWEDGDHGEYDPRAFKLRTGI